MSGKTLAEEINYRLLVSIITPQHHAHIPTAELSTSVDNSMKIGSMSRDIHIAADNSKSDMSPPHLISNNMAGTFQVQQAYPARNSICRTEYMESTNMVPSTSPQTTANSQRQTMNPQDGVTREEGFSLGLSPIKPVRSRSRWSNTSTFQHSAQSSTRNVGAWRSTSTGHGRSTGRQPPVARVTRSSEDCRDSIEENHASAVSISSWPGASMNSENPYVQVSPSRQPDGPTEDNFGHFRSTPYLTDRRMRLRHLNLNTTAAPLNHTPLIAEPKTNFRPSGMWYRKRDLLGQNSLPGTIQSEKTGYQGDLNGASYMSQLPNLADDLNCALWVKNIPPSMSAADIFDIINCGAIFSMHINEPNHLHLTAAAKIVFMEPGSAAEFIAKGKQGIWMGDQKLDVRYNRYGSKRWEGDRTRILLVEGPIAIMTFEYWDVFFRQFCEFEWDRVLEVDCPRMGRGALEFRFMRIDGQAQMCLKALLSHPDHKDVSAEYGPDPCDPQSH